MRGKLIISLIAFVLIIIGSGSAIYAMTVGEAKDREDEQVVKARERLESRLSPTDVKAEGIFRGEDAYAVFRYEKDGKAQRAFVPLDYGAIETRPVEDAIPLETVAEDARAATGGRVISVKYGFENRALIEVVTQNGSGYDYSYYTYQEGSLIKRLTIN